MTGGSEDRRQAERRLTARRQALAYQGAFEAVIAILVAAGIGYAVDAHFDVAPVGLLVGVAVGFGSFVLRLLRLGRRLQELAQSDEEDTGP